MVCMPRQLKRPGGELGLLTRGSHWRVLGPAARIVESLSHAMRLFAPRSTVPIASRASAGTASPARVWYPSSHRSEKTPVKIRVVLRTMLAAAALSSGGCVREPEGQFSPSARVAKLEPKFRE